MSGPLDQTVVPDSPLRLSALVITRQERENIDRCLSALKFCDEIVVLDSESTDGTVEAARRHTERVFVEPWRGYSAQKERALQLCRGRWVLWVDADEVVTPELSRSIQGAMESDPPGGAPGPAAFLIRRRVRYLGRWIGHGGWGSDWVLRLFRREGARFSGDRVHERVLVPGAVGRLNGILEHHSYRDLDHHWEKIGRLSRLWAEQARAEGRRAHAGDLIVRPVASFLSRYFLRLGFLDGWRGLVIAWLGAAYVFLKYARLMEGDR